MLVLAPDEINCDLILATTIPADQRSSVVNCSITRAKIRIIRGDWIVSAYYYPSCGNYCHVQPLSGWDVFRIEPITMQNIITSTNMAQIRFVRQLLYKFMIIKSLIYTDILSKIILLCCTPAFNFDTFIDTSDLKLCLFET